MRKIWGCCLLLCLWATAVTSQPKVDKVQAMVTLLKKLYQYREGGQAYITDGERVFWVKYYKTWTPQDLVIFNKENPKGLHFLSEACQHGRVDVLQTLMPDYYRYNGGVKAFADDITRIASQKKGHAGVLWKSRERLCYTNSLRNIKYSSTF